MSRALRVINPLWSSCPLSSHKRNTPSSMVLVPHHHTNDPHYLHHSVKVPKASTCQPRLLQGFQDHHQHKRAPSCIPSGDRGTRTLWSRQEGFKGHSMCKSMHDQGPHHPQATKHPSVIIPSYKWVQDLPYALGPSPRVPRLHMALHFHQEYKDL